MSEKEWREFVERMHSPEVQAVVAKYVGGEPEPQPQQAVLWEES